MKQVRIASAAEKDLEEIWLYIAVDNVDAADKFIDRVLDQLGFLAGTPRMGRSRNDIVPNLRSWPVGNYVVFYRDTAVALEIVRVLHGARDVDSLF